MIIVAIVEESTWEGQHHDGGYGTSTEYFNVGVSVVAGSMREQRL
jgi:hypothetical protein